VRAQTDVPSWVLADPISDAVKAVEERLTSLEAKVSSVSEAVASRPSTEHQLCVADDAGARTCINKAQLDRLLRMMQAAAIEPPAQVTDSVTTNVATTAPAPVEPVQAVASAPETKASEESSRIETTQATIVEAPRQEAQAAQAALAQETLDGDSMPTGSVPASAASDGRALVIHPEVEITTPPTEH
jgi:hypothetical protein